METKQHVAFEVQGPVGIVRWKGSLTVSNVDEFRGQLFDWLEVHKTIMRLIIDLSEVDMVDSSGLGGLLAMLKVMRERDGDILLAGVSKKVRLLFEITSADSLFGMHVDLDAAKAAVLPAS